jgi:hypothetical protein
MRIVTTISLLLPLASMAFEPPTPERKRAAVGDLTELTTP